MVLQRVGSFASTSHNFVLALPPWSEFASILLLGALGDLSRDEIAHLEFSRLDSFIDGSLDSLLVGCDSDLGLLSFFLGENKIQPQLRRIMIKI